MRFAPLALPTGVAAAEAPEPPHPERFEAPAATARLVNAARAADGRAVAVGTTAVRALESAAGPDGVVREAAGRTALVVTPERGVRVVDGLSTGLHEPQASHLLMLEAIAGRAAPDRGCAEAPRHLHLCTSSAAYPSSSRRRALTLGIARATIGEIGGRPV